MKNFLYFLLGMVAAILIFTLTVELANASGNHHHHNHTIIEQTIIEQTINNEINRSSAAIGAAAGSHQFYWGTKNWKWSVTGSHYNDSTALSGAIGKRFDNTLIHFSVSTEDEQSKYQYGFGIGGDF